MKARPILFNTDMVKAILAGHKTQTRRAVNADMAANFDEPRGAEDVPAGYPFVETEDGYVSALKLCPFGKPGDFLYVREAFAKVPRTAYAQSTGVTKIINPEDEYQAAIFRAGWERCKPGSWVPSIHMPRWASRLTLEITDVRVERLQEISNEDALAEGIGAPLDQRYAAIDAFRPLWNSIYGNWDVNPWVWVVEYKVHHCNVDALLREREAA